MRQILAAATGLALLLSGKPALSELYPPWIEAASLSDLHYASADDIKAVADWYFERHHLVDVQQSKGYIALWYVIYDLAYPYVNPENDNAELAIELAERIRMFGFDAKELILADLKYAPNGTEPDPIRYRHSIEKTAIYLTQFSGLFFFPLTVPDYRSVTRDALEQELRDGYAERLTPPLPGAIEEFGDGAAFGVAREVLNELFAVTQELGRLSRCEALKRSLGFLNGESHVGRDVEMAEMLLQHAHTLRAGERGVADVYYTLASNPSPFHPLDRTSLADSYMGLAADDGHPEASYSIGRQDLLDGKLSTALEYLSTASLQGHVGAKMLLDDLREERDAGPTKAQVDLAQYSASNYEKTRCLGI